MNLLKKWICLIKISLKVQNDKMSVAYLTLLVHVSLMS